MKCALDATAKHLESRQIISAQIQDSERMMHDLAKKSSHYLQRATTESLAFIAYLKRFASKKD